MKDYDIELSNDRITESLKNDTLKRNKRLSNLMKLLNNIECGKIIAIDGKWGCGKTVFIKQLQLLNEMDMEEISNINPDQLFNFKNKYSVYYYNAWENDHHDSPLLSLIYNLINDYPSEKAQIASYKTELPINFKEGLKTLTSNFIDIDKVESLEDITKNIYTTEEKRDALSNLINSIIPENKKLVFIIDELDRCKPSYAVEMLEVIKHFYLNDRIVFIVGTNNEQLAHTISNYYGSGFDGYGYLSKLYNLIIELDEISPKDYLNSVIEIKDSGWIESSIYAVCDYFKFQMRDINRIVNDFNILNEYLSTRHIKVYGEDDILKYIFLPYCLGLKIKSKKMLNEFLQGNGYASLEKYVKSNKRIFNIALYDYKGDGMKNVEYTEEDVIKNLQQKYNLYFLENTEVWDAKAAKKEFLSVFTLLVD